MSILVIEFLGGDSDDTKKFCFGPSNSLVAFLSGGAISVYDKKTSSTIETPITSILTQEECAYVLPVDKSEYEDFEDEESNNLRDNEDKNPQQLQTIFMKIEAFYTDKLYRFNEEIPLVWKEDNIKNTLWDYRFICDIITCLDVIKTISSEIKYYCGEDL